MPTTSLLILLVVAIWAAYLLQHWIHRREAMATARSVDRFSEAMRVLAKRDPLPQGIAPMVRARPTATQAPQVSVKTPRTSLRAGQPMVGEQMNDEQHRPQQSSTTGRRAGIGAAGKHALATVRGLDGRQVRGISLLAALGFTILTLVLAPFAVVSWWLPVIGLVACGAVVAWLRHAAVAQQRSRTAAPSRAPRRTVRSESFAAAGDSVPFEPQVAAPAPASHDAGASPAPFGFEEQAVSPAPSRAAAPAADGTGWSPTEVPRPTYAMKERAPQTQVVPAATVDEVRVEDLPFDGLALDEDLEELPAVYRAG